MAKLLANLIFTFPNTIRMKNFALIFGRGQYVSRNIKLLEDNGFIPLIIDYSTNLYQKTHHFCLISPGNEINEIDRYIQANNGQVKLVINRIDLYIELYSKLIDHFHLHGPSYQATHFFRDKALMHEKMIEAGLNFFRPRTIVCQVEKINQYLNQLQLPVVIKPYMGAHSRGVYFINKIEEVELIKKSLQSFFHTSRDFKFKKKKQNKILIEEYLDGKLIVPVSYINNKGKCITLSYFDVIRAKDLNLNHMQLLYRTAPSKVPYFISQKIQFILQKMADQTGLKSTFISPEFMIVGKKVFLIEVNVRAGGFRYEAMKYAFGIDIDQLSIDLAQGKEIDDNFKFVKNCTATEVWEEKSGIIESIKIPKSKFIQEQQILLSPGDKYQSPPTGNKAIAKFYVTSEREDSLKIAKNIRKKIQIEFETNPES